MKYRREIDGLRSIAVLPVILFHAGFEVFSGGYVGVDVFFVISGYLITTILLGELESNDYSIARFYERRARRILPALFFVLLCVTVGAWHAMLPSQLEDYGRALISVVLFVSNIHFWQELDYFAPAAEANPLLHTWSLAVEEQFYIVFPLLLALLWRFGRRAAFWLVVALSVASLALAQVASTMAPTANFFLIPTRAWELGAGSICAFLLQGRKPWASAPLSALGLALVVAPIFLYDAETPFPSVWALAPVGGAALVILFGAGSTPVGRLLSIAPLVGIGLISYSAYLWHQPLFAFARTLSLSHPSPALMGGLAVLTLVLAWATWRFVEQPFRRGQGGLLPTRRGVFAASAAGGVALVLLGGYDVASKGRLAAWEAAHPERARVYAMIEDVAEEKDARRDDGACRFNVALLDDAVAARVLDCARRLGPGLAVLGDSHAIDLFDGMSMVHDGPFLVGITSGGCRPGARKPDFVAECQYDGVAAFLRAHPKAFSSVVFTQSGSYFVRADGRTGDKVFAQIPETEALPVAELEIDRDGVAKALTYLDAIDATTPVVWVGPRIEPRIGVNYILRGGCDFPFALREGARAVFGRIDAAIAEAVRAEGSVSYVSQLDAVGFDMARDFMTCDRLYWRDGDHWSQEGSRRFVGRLLEGPDPALARALPG